MAKPQALQSLFDIERSELPLTLLMFSYFFLVITSFWILKPIKKALFIEHYDQSGFQLLTWHLSAAQAELLVKVLNMVVAIVAVVVFSWLAQRFRRQQLTYIFTGFFMLGYLAYSAIIDHPGGFTVWTFYLFGDLLRQPTHPMLGLPRTSCRTGSPTAAIWCF